MIGRMQPAWLLHLALGLMLFTGLFPMPTMSMQDGHMFTFLEVDTYHEKASAGHNMMGYCCNDTFGSLVMVCGILIPHYDGAIHSAGNQRVALSPLFIPITYHKIVTPPPKI